MKLLLAPAFAALASAVPVNVLDPRSASSFTVHQTANPNFKASGSKALIKSLLKYQANDRASAVIAATQSGSVTATPADQYDSEYLSPVKIGNQNFKLDFDTGSSDLWVLGASLKSQGGSGHTYYSPTVPRLSGYTWRISYGDGSGASGTVYKDTVVVGGVTVTSQAVEYATSASSAFLTGPEDGLLGLAFSTLNTVSPTKQLTFFDNAINQGLARPLFAADLKYHAAGSYDFGLISTSKYTGSITYTSVDSSQGFWTFTPSGYAVGSGSTRTGSLTGIADTGTTLILAADSVVSAYYAQVSGAVNSNTYGGYVFPCSATLPTFTLVIGSYRAVVPGRYMNYAPVTTGSSTCYGGIQSDDGIGFAIYGDVFLKSQYVIFDKTGGSPRLGFAAQS